MFLALAGCILCTKFRDGMPQLLQNLVTQQHNLLSFFANAVFLIFSSARRSMHCISFSRTSLPFSVLTNFVTENANSFIRCAFCWGFLFLIILVHCIEFCLYICCQHLSRSLFNVKILRHLRQYVMVGSSSPPTALARSKIGAYCRTSAALRSVFHDCKSCTEYRSPESLVQ